MLFNVVEVLRYHFVKIYDVVNLQYRLTALITCLLFCNSVYGTQHVMEKSGAQVQAGTGGNIHLEVSSGLLDSAFTVSGHQSNVNTFNGSNNLYLPFGSYRVGELSYDVGLAYNSNFWTTFQDCIMQWDDNNPADHSLIECGDVTFPDPDTSMAGAGWQLTVPRIYPPKDLSIFENNPYPEMVPYPNLSTTKWLLVEGNGTKIEFVPENGWPGVEDGTHFYSTNASNARLVTNSANSPTGVVIDNVNGISMRFARVNSPYCRQQSQWMDIEEDRVRELPHCFLIQSIEDTKGQSVNYAWTHSATGLSKLTISDSYDRNHEVTFNHAGSAVAEEILGARQKVLKIVLNSNGGTLKQTITPTYSAADVKRRSPHSHNGLRGVNGYESDVDINRLDHITLNDGTKYSFTYDTSYENSHSISGYTLPSGGRVSFEFGNYDFPKTCETESLNYYGTGGIGRYASGVEGQQRISVTGITSQTYTDPFTGQTATTSYDIIYDDDAGHRYSGVSGDTDCQRPRWFKNVVTSPTASNGTYSKVTSYYSIATEDTGNWNKDEYGLGIYKDSSIVSSETNRPLYLASITELCDSSRCNEHSKTYVRYLRRMESGTCEEGDGKDCDRRESVIAETYTQQLSDGVDVGKGRVYSGYDGMGNFRTVKYYANGYKGETELTSTTDFNSPSATIDGDIIQFDPATLANYEDWILSTYDSTTISSDGGSVTTKYKWQGGSKICQEIDGWTTNYSFNSKGLLENETKAFAKCGLVAGESVVTANTYHASGALATSKVTTLTENLINNEHNVIGQVTKTTSPAGVQTTIQYNSQGFIKSTNTAGSVAVNATYGQPEIISAKPGWMQIQRGANGAELDLQKAYYDGKGRVFKMEDAAAGGAKNVSIITRDGLDSTTSLSLNGTIIQRSSFDGLGRILSSSGRFGETTISYLGDRVQTATLDGLDTVTEYDGLGRVVLVKRPERICEYYRYNVFGSVTEIVRKPRPGTVCESSFPANGGQRRTFTYDTKGRVTSETTPEIGMIEFSDFTVLGKPKTVKTPTETITYTYDDLGRVLTASEGSISLVSNSYNLGRLTQSVRHNQIDGSDYLVTQDYSFHPATSGGRLHQTTTTIEYPSPTGEKLSKSFVQANHYDSDLGLLQSLDYPTCSDCGSPVSRSVGYEYENGDMVAIYGGSKININFAYENNYLTDIAFSGFSDLLTRRTPNSKFVTQNISVLSGNNVAMNMGNIDYDARGNVTGVGSNNYVYDGLSRLTSATTEIPDKNITKSNTYSYDAFDNLISIGQGGNENVRAINIDETNNQISSYAYDDAGRVLFDGCNAYRYDQLGMIVKVMGSGSDSAPPECKFNFTHLYDASNLRVLTMCQNCNEREDAGPSPAIQPDFTYTVIGRAVTFVSELDDPDQVITDITWLFGDGSTSVDEDARHTYQNFGEYDVTLVITDSLGRQSQITKYVNVKQPGSPDAAFTISQGGQSSRAIGYYFNDTSTPGDTNIVAWHWDYGNGQSETFSSNQSTEHIFSFGTYNVSLTVTDSNGKADTTTQQLIVSNDSVAEVDFSWYRDVDNSQKVFFQSDVKTGTARITERLWEFGDGNTSTALNPVHEYDAEGEYEVSLTLTDNLADRAVVRHMISTESHGPVFASFESYRDGLSVQFVDTTKFDLSHLEGTQVGVTFSYEWDFGDGNSITSTEFPFHTYATSGEYTVTLNILGSDGSNGTVSRLIEVSTSQQPALSFEQYGVAIQPPLIFETLPFSNRSQQLTIQIRNTGDSLISGLDALSSNESLFNATLVARNSDDQAGLTRSGLYAGEVRDILVEKLPAIGPVSATLRVTSEQGAEREILITGDTLEQTGSLPHITIDDTHFVDGAQINLPVNQEAFTSLITITNNGQSDVLNINNLRLINVDGESGSLALFDEGTSNLTKDFSLTEGESKRFILKRNDIPGNARVRLNFEHNGLGDPDAIFDVEISSTLEDCLPGYWRPGLVKGCAHHQIDDHFEMTRNAKQLQYAQLENKFLPLDVLEFPVSPFEGTSNAELALFNNHQSLNMQVQAAMSTPAGNSLSHCYAITSLSTSIGPGSSGKIVFTRLPQNSMNYNCKGHVDLSLNWNGEKIREVRFYLYHHNLQEDCSNIDSHYESLHCQELTIPGDIRYRHEVKYPDANIVGATQVEILHNSILDLGIYHRSELEPRLGRNSFGNLENSVWAYREITSGPSFLGGGILVPEVKYGEQIFKGNSKHFIQLQEGGRFQSLLHGRITRDKEIAVWNYKEYDSDLTLGDHYYMLRLYNASLEEIHGFEDGAYSWIKTHVKAGKHLTFWERANQLFYRSSVGIGNSAQTSSLRRISRPFQIKNEGLEPLTVSYHLDGDAEFNMEEQQDVVIAPGEGHVFRVRMDLNSTVGFKRAKLIINNDSGNAPQRYVVDLWGQILEQGTSKILVEDLSNNAPLDESTIENGDKLDVGRAEPKAAAVVARTLRIHNTAYSELKLHADLVQPGDEPGFTLVGQIPNEIHAGSFVDIQIEMPLDHVQNFASELQMFVANDVEDPLNVKEAETSEYFVTEIIGSVVEIGMEDSAQVETFLFGQPTQKYLVANDSVLDVSTGTSTIQPILRQDDGSVVRKIRVHNLSSEDIELEVIALTMGAAGGIDLVGSAPSHIPLGEFVDISARLSIDTIGEYESEYSILFNGTEVHSFGLSATVVEDSLIQASDDFAPQARPAPLGSQHSGIIVNVLANDRDNGSIVDATTMALHITRAPANGIASVTTDNQIRYVPNRDFRPFGSVNQVTDSLEYEVSNQQGGVDRALVNFTLTNRKPTAAALSPVRLRPRALEGAVHGNLASSITNVISPGSGQMSPSDPDGDELKLREGEHFIVNREELKAKGWLINEHLVRENDNEIGITLPDSVRPGQGEETLVQTIVYQIIDEFGKRANGSFDVEVGNARPVPVDDVVFLRPGRSTVTINLVENDKDLNGDHLVLMNDVIDEATSDLLTGFVINRVNDHSIEITVPASFKPANGQDVVTKKIAYRIRDGFGGRAKGHLYLHVTNNAPELVTQNLRFGAVIDANPTEIDLTHFINDVDGDLLKITSVSANAGEVSNAGLTVTYDPKNTYVGWDTVRVSVSDFDAQSGMSARGQTTEMTLEVPVSRFRGVCSPRCKYVLGDWDGDGVDTLAALAKIRNEHDSNDPGKLAFILTNEHAASESAKAIVFHADESFPLSDADFDAFLDMEILAGDWNGDDRDSPMFVRNVGGLLNYYLISDHELNWTCDILASGVTQNGATMLQYSDLSHCPIWTSDHSHIHHFRWSGFMNRPHKVISGDWDGDGIDSIATYHEVWNRNAGHFGRFKPSVNLMDGNNLAFNINASTLQPDPMSGLASSTSLANEVRISVVKSELIQELGLDNEIEFDYLPISGDFNGNGRDSVALWQYPHSPLPDHTHSVYVLDTITSSTKVSERRFKGFNPNDSNLNCEDIKSVMVGDLRGGFDSKLGNNEQLVLHRPNESAQPGCLWLSPLALEGVASFENFDLQSGTIQPVPETPEPRENCGSNQVCAKSNSNVLLDDSVPVPLGHKGDLNSSLFGSVNGTSVARNMFQQAVNDSEQASFAFAHSISGPGANGSLRVGSLKRQPVKLYVHHKNGSASAEMSFWNGYSNTFSTSTKALVPAEYTECSTLCFYVNNNNIPAESGEETVISAKSQGQKSSIRLVIVNGNDVPVIGQLNVSNSLSASTQLIAPTKNIGIQLAANTVYPEITITGTHGVADLYEHIAFESSDVVQTTDFSHSLKFLTTDACRSLCVYQGNSRLASGSDIPVLAAPDQTVLKTYKIVNGSQQQQNIAVEMLSTSGASIEGSRVHAQRCTQGSCEMVQIESNGLIAIDANSETLVSLYMTHLSDNAGDFTDITTNIAFVGGEVFTLHYSLSDCEDLCFYKENVKLGNSGGLADMLSLLNRDNSITLSLLNASQNTIDLSDISVSAPFTMTSNVNSIAKHSTVMNALTVSHSPNVRGVTEGVISVASAYETTFTAQTILILTNKRKVTKTELLLDTVMNDEALELVVSHNEKTGINVGPVRQNSTVQLDVSIVNKALDSRSFMLEPAPGVNLVGDSQINIPAKRLVKLRLEFKANENIEEIIRIISDRGEVSSLRVTEIKKQTKTFNHPLLVPVN